jgi:hypothetical protein
MSKSKTYFVDIAELEAESLAEILDVEQRKREIEAAQRALAQSLGLFNELYERANSAERAARLEKEG